MELVYKNAPYEKQAEALDKSYGKEFFAYLMGPGTGKTFVTIVEAANLYLEGKCNFVCVVAPSGVDVQWAVEEVPKHCPVPSASYVFDGTKTQKEKRNLQKFLQTKNVLKFFCVRIDVFSRLTYIRLLKNIVSSYDTYFAIDEASRIKNPEAERSYNLVYLMNTALTLAGEEVDLLTAKEKQNRGVMTKIESFVTSTKYRRILTGTIVTTNPFNLFTPFDFLKYNFFECRFSGFRARHGIEIREKGIHDKDYFRPISKQEITAVGRYLAVNATYEEISQKMKISESSVEWIHKHPDIRTPYKRLEELKIAIEPYSFKCSIEDMRDIEAVRETVFVDMTADQARIYHDLEEDLITQYENHTLTVPSKLALLTRLSQVTSGYFPLENITCDADGEVLSKETTLVPIGKNNPKIQAVKDELWEHNFDTPVLIFGRFTADIKTLYKELQKEFPLLTINTYYGDTEEKERNRVKLAFQDGQVDILVCNPSLAGIGLNLQRASNTIYFSSDYSYEKRKQADGRTIRADQKANTVLLKNIVCRETIDERVLEVLTEKNDLAEYFRETSIREFLGGLTA